MRSLTSWISAAVVPLAAVLGLVTVLVIWSPRRQAPQIGQDIWTCSMHPQVRLPRPGPCPICGMNLIRLSQLPGQKAQLEARAGLETAPVAYRELFKEIRTVGKFDYNERRVAYISARVAGRVDRVFADFTGMQVKQGDHLVQIYSPELYLAQGELIRALDAFESETGNRRFLQTTLDAARTKLRLLGLLPEQILEVENSRKPATHLTIYSPQGGTVIEKSVREGQYVKEGDALYRIADLDPIWLYLDIYEYDLSWIRYGQKVDVLLEAYPAEPFQGVVVFIDRFLDDTTRTVKVRVNLKNSHAKFKPAMYATAVIHVRLQSDGTPEPTGIEGKYICPMHPEIVAEQPGDCSLCEMPLEKVPDQRPQPPDGVDPAAANSAPAGKVLSIPSSAVLDTGRRKIAYRKTKAGEYELVELHVGPRASAHDAAGQVGSYYPILHGVQEGDEVVVRGGFLLDSQRQIEGLPSLLSSEGASGGAMPAGHKH